MKSIDCQETLYYLGPDEKEGPLPAIFYFALSAEESLTHAPICHPLKPLLDLPVRIFSATLPFHEQGLPADEGLQRWADEFKKGRDPLSPFFLRLQDSLLELESKKLLAKGRLGVMGLSRGGFVACHLAARVKEISCIAAFAPLTFLSAGRDFQGLDVGHLDLVHLVPRLTHKKVRFTIGNHDRRVGTERCFQFVDALVKRNFEERLRSPPVELFITPSIGHDGHGTSDPSFYAGGTWIAEQLT